VDLAWLENVLDFQRGAYVLNDRSCDYGGLIEIACFVVGGGAKQVLGSFESSMQPGLAANIFVSRINPVFVIEED
jgi:hypothetical protein